ncbi:hypothetical protein GS634_21290 [Ruegeria atlantica]|uniref:Transmembrane protein n=1 Tax=Ruegeria atlantica TaxID=81569 RepID=A0AA90YX51_9RHOB|nr:hypothetical protein [Ruegeria atlantica]NOE20672.1 hypothetical protein [Ruegeria atlantica]
MTDARIPARLLFVSAVIAAVLFLPTAGIGIARSGYNPDEWRFAAGLERGFAEVHGRWAAHWAHEVLFEQGASIAILVSIIFAALFGVAALIAREAIATTGPAMVVASILTVFLAGSSHVYLTELLHYQTLAPWFCLGLLASVGAMVLVKPQGRWSRSGLLLRMAVAAELLAISIGFYQSYVLLGFIIPALVLIRVDRFDHRQCLFFLLRVLIASGAALILYQLQRDATIYALDLKVDFRFSSGIDTAVLADKLSALYWIEKLIHSGGLLGMPSFYRRLFLLSLAAACILVLAAATIAVFAAGRLSASGLIGGLRVLVGGLGALFILPVLIWFLYPEPYLIGRSIGFVGFIFVGIVLASGTVIAQAADGVSISRLVLAGVMSLCLVYGVGQVVASSHIWPLFNQMAERDIELADAIVERARLLDGFNVRSTPIRSVGEPWSPSLKFGDFQTQSTFHRGVDMNSIFQVRYGATDYAGSVLTPPQACTGFPVDGSVFMVDDTLFVCFEHLNPLRVQLTCFPLGGNARGAICYSDGMAVLIGQTCADIDPGTGQIVATQLDEAGRWIRSNQFYWQAKDTEMNGLCYRFVETANLPFSTLRIEHKLAASETAWMIEYDVKDARPLEEIFDTFN